MTALNVVWIISAIGGAIAYPTAVVVADRRERAFAVAAICFAVAGVLGILTIGIVFLGLAVWSLFAALRSEPRKAGAHQE